MADLATMYVGIGTPVPDAGDPKNGVTKYTVNVVEFGASEASIKPTAYRKNITFYVFHEGQGDENAGYERVEPSNTSNGNVAFPTSSYQNIAVLLNSTVLAARVKAAVITQCSVVFQEVGASTTSLTVATGAQTLTTNTGKSYTAGTSMSLTNNGNTMIGTVTSYNSGTGALVLNITAITGSGTFASWTVSPTNHANRMKLILKANTGLDGLSIVTSNFMSAIALNATVQTAGTAVTDAVLLAIVAGSWDSYATLIVA
jgi:hypothetical protein